MAILVTFYLMKSGLLQRLRWSFVAMLFLPSVVFGFQTDFYTSTLKSIESHLAKDELDIIIEKFGELASQPEFSQLPCYQKGTLLHKVGVTYYMLDREYKAIEKFSLVIDDLWQNCSDVPPQEKANTLYNIGICYQYTEEKYRAKSYIERSITLLEGDPSTPANIMAEKYHGAGAYFEDIKDYERAQSHLQSALDIYQEGPTTAIEIFDILNRMLILSLDFRQFDEVFSFYEKALDLQSKYPAQIAKIELSQIYLNTGTAYIDTEDYKEARGIALKALNFLDSIKNPYLYHNALELLGMSYKKEGKLQQAKPYYDKVLDFRMDPKSAYRHSSLARSIALENMSELLLAEERFAEALQTINQAIFQLTPTTDRNKAGDPIITGQYLNYFSDLIRQLMIKVKILQNLSKSYSGPDLPYHNLTLLEKVDTLIGLSIIDFASDRSQLELLHLIADNYSQLVVECLNVFQATQDQKYLRKAWQFSNRSKALVLQRHLIQSEALNNSLSSTQVYRHAQLQENIRRITEKLQYAASAEDVDTLRQEALKAHRILEIFRDSLEVQYPQFRKARRQYLPTPDLETLRSNFSFDQVAIEFFVTPHRLISFWITKELFFQLDSDLDASFLKILDEVTSSQLDPTQPYATNASAHLYNQLLGKGLKQLPSEINRIIVIPDGNLHGLSFESLESGNGPIIKDYAISHTFSSSLIVNKASPSSNKEFIGYGTGYSSELNTKLQSIDLIDSNLYLPQFNLAENEVRAGGKIFNGTANTGVNASLIHFLQYASSANVIHLSLHGLVDHDNPNKSCILFDDRAINYILNPQILQQQPLQSELVILSSCHSADGKVYRGEGVSGMTRAFLYAGAKSVISSLWSATEQASFQIIQSFLEGVNRGHFKDQALQSAKIDYLEQAPPSQKHPYYWANFILVGQSTPIFQGTRNLPLVISLSAFGFLILFLLFRNK